MTDDLIVEVTIRRANNPTPIIHMTGRATAPLEWRAHYPMAEIVSLCGDRLNYFRYTPFRPEQV